VNQRTGFYKAKFRLAFASFIRTYGEKIASLPSATDLNRLCRMDRGSRACRLIRRFTAGGESHPAPKLNLFNCHRSAFTDFPHRTTGFFVLQVWIMPQLLDLYRYASEINAEASRIPIEFSLISLSLA
jgi:hypothetical protein